MLYKDIERKKVDQSLEKECRIKLAHARRPVTSCERAEAAASEA
jgi:hypothetical protein